MSDLKYTFKSNISYVFETSCIDFEPVDYQTMYSTYIIIRVRGFFVSAFSPLITTDDQLTSAYVPVTG